MSQHEPSAASRAFATRVIHAGQAPDPTTGALMPPIYANSTYLQDSPGVHKGFDYGRSHNPTRFALERCVADLEGGSRAFAFASGLAAISTVLELLDAGAHVVSGNDLYGGTFRLFDKVRQRSAGHRFSFVDLTAPDALPAALQEDTRMVWIETPSNPLLSLTDLAAVARLCRDRGILCVADNTFASPWVQRPLELGFDIVVHSTTKYLNGHSDVIGGIAVVGQNAELAERLGFLQNAVGAISGPFDAFLTLRGVKTLALRMERHCSNALELATWLERQPQVARVHYPGLPSHPQHELARRQRNDFCRPENRSRRLAALPGKRADIRPGREPGRRGKPDRTPGDHDPRHHPGAYPCTTGHRRCAGAPVGGRGGCRGLAGRLGAGPGAHLKEDVPTSRQAIGYPTNSTIAQCQPSDIACIPSFPLLAFATYGIPVCSADYCSRRNQ